METWIEARSNGSLNVWQVVRNTGEFQTDPFRSADWYGLNGRGSTVCRYKGFESLVFLRPWESLPHALEAEWS
jgi:hypothetical protein